MISDKSRAIIVRKIRSAAGLGVGVWQARVERALEDKDLVVMTREEMLEAVKKSFLEGQEFEIERRAAAERARAAQSALKRKEQAEKRTAEKQEEVREMIREADERYRTSPWVLPPLDPPGLGDLAVQASESRSGHAPRISATHFTPGLSQEIRDAVKTAHQHTTFPRYNWLGRRIGRS